MAEARPLRLVLIGWGAIATRVAALLSERGTPARVVAVALRNGSVPRTPLPPGAVLIDDPAALSDLSPDLVLEAAGREALRQWAGAALDAAPRLVVASTSALADDAFREALIAQAVRARSRIEITPGAIGGIDALRAASVLPVESVRHTIAKPPAAWAGTPGEAILADAPPGAVTLFRGSAREAARLYPQNANATATTALAGIGLDRTEVEIVSDPALSRNRHVIEIDGAAGRMRVDLENAPSATNPKSSELTALSLVRAVENAVLPLCL
jgi:aspartate dehydrogenase